MKAKRRIKYLSVPLVLCLALLAACSSNGKNETGNAATETKPPTATSSTEVKPNTDPLGKYEPAIEISTVRMDDGVTKFTNGDSWDNNIWYKAYEQDLGIRVKNKWIAPLAGNQYSEKLNVSIASSDLPDIFQVDGGQLQQLADAGLIMDLKDVYETYASPKVKELLNLDQGVGMNSATIGGKLMAVPVLTSYSDYAGFVWVRTDWMKKYNLPEPKTMNDVWTIAETFKKENAGGKNTVGLPLRKDLMGDLGGIDQIFQGYHAYPRMWIPDASGNLVYGSIQPEMKTALAKLQEEYKAGVIDREYGVKDYQKVCEVLTSGKAGIYFGGMADPLGCTQAGHDQDGALWKPLPLVSSDDKPAKPGISVTPGGFYVVKKGAAHPEALIKLINLFAAKGDSADRDKYFQAEKTGDTQPFHYAPFQVWQINENVDFYRVFMKHAKGEDISDVKQDRKDVVAKIDAYLKGDQKQWAWYAIFGDESTQQVIDQYLQNNMYIFNGYYGPGTGTMKDKNAILAKMESEMITRVIMGASSLDDFDKFVSEWKKLGGDQITKEVNEWAQAHQKQ
ncbi:extracellular solute-binding protein [Cohnella nanjingensis]|uniref:Extracellular solute-binding protein n=1 Tax=Cohnella nanjingensis TaxID=1387779 RepID=A0A7X0RME4_9BACL|nr:extracellular solute-binding protein [Cohnella nanjingensis]MBB6670199.1 extracellular solute-binding protein [Cohnella nanjingensis]